MPFTLMYNERVWYELEKRLRYVYTKFLRIRRESGGFFFGFKLVVYTEVTNPV